MGRQYDFKYLVIGGGPAGSSAAMELAKAKKNVGLIEGRLYGGANLITRDVPYTAALDFAHTYYRTLHLPEFGFQELSFSFPAIISHQMNAMLNVSSIDNSRIAEKTGLIYIEGYAQFLDPHTVAVGERQFSSENFILATGSHLNTASIEGLDTVRYLSPDLALKVHRLPEAVIVIGGGSTGCEIAEYYATLGAKTLIAERSSRLLPTEDREVGETMQAHFVDDLGITVLTNSEVIALGQDALSKYVVFVNDGVEKMVRVDTIILATGSAPNLGCGLEKTGVKLNKNGSLRVDKLFQTSEKHIYAIGDCAIGQPDVALLPSTHGSKTTKKSKNAKNPPITGNFAPDSSTERAEYEGRILARSFIDGSKALPNYKGLPRLTNTLPAVACYGPTEIALKKQHVRYKKAFVELGDTPAGKILDTHLGFVKLLADHSGHIISGQIVSENAAALGAEIAIAIRHRLTAIELASAPHATNDLSYAVQLAAKRLVLSKRR